jgi:hypothetical protein
MIDYSKDNHANDGDDDNHANDDNNEGEGVGGEKANAPSYKDDDANRLGKNKNTTATYTNGNNCFERSMHVYGLTIPTLTEADVNVELFETFAGNAVLLRQLNDAAYKEGTLPEYYRKAKEQIKKRFPIHPFWTATIEQGEGGGKSGEDYCLYMAQQLGNHSSRTVIEEALDNTAPAIYEPSMIECITNILRESNPKSFEDGFLTLITYMAMGRGGEARLMSWKTTELDGYMQLLASKWFEEKTIRGYPLGFMSAFKEMEMDVFFLLNGFFMKGGLFRATGTAILQKYRVFSKNSGFATHISKIVKKHSGVKNATSRSLRRGTMTLTHACRSLNEKDSNARGGHMPTDNKKHYITPLLESTIPAGMILAGHKHLPEKVNFPELTNHLKGEEWESVIDECYGPISLPEFETGGRLRPLLRVTLATMMRYYIESYRKYQTSEGCAVMQIITKLKVAVAKQQSFISSGKQVHAFLSDVCRDVINRYGLKNRSDARNQALHDLVATQAERLSEVNRELEFAKEDRHQQALEINDLKQGQTEIIQMLRQALQSRSKSPSPYKSSPQKRGFGEMQDGGGASSQAAKGGPSGGGESSTGGGESSTGGGESSTGGGESKGTASVQLSFSTGAYTSGAGVTLLILLSDIAKSKQMGSILTSHFNYNDEQSKIRNALTLANQEMTSDELTDLREYTRPIADIMQICQDIQDRCMEVLRQLEADAKQTPKSRAKATFLGIGKRLQDLKKTGHWGA